MTEPASPPFFDDPLPDTGSGSSKNGRGERRGERIIQASWVGTAVLFVTSLLAVTVEAADLTAAIVDLLLFAGGVAVFLWAYGVAVGRSRTVEIGIGGLYFLQGTAPRRAQLHLMGSLAAQVAIAIAAAAIRPFTSLAFSILAPMWGLGLAGLWGARYGRFGPRQLTRDEPAHED